MKTIKNQPFLVVYHTWILHGWYGGWVYPDSPCNEPTELSTKNRGFSMKVPRFQKIQNTDVIYIYILLFLSWTFFCLNHLCCWPSPVGINLEMLLCHTIAWLLIWLVVPWQWVVVFTGSVPPRFVDEQCGVRRFDSLKLGSPHAPRHFEIFCRKESWRVGQFSV